MYERQPSTKSGHMVVRGALLRMTHVQYCVVAALKYTRAIEENLAMSSWSGSRPSMHHRSSAPFCTISRERNSKRKIQERIWFFLPQEMTMYKGTVDEGRYSQHCSCHYQSITQCVIFHYHPQQLYCKQDLNRLLYLTPSLRTKVPRLRLSNFIRNWMSYDNYSDFWMNIYGFLTCLNANRTLEISYYVASTNHSNFVFSSPF